MSAARPSRKLTGLDLYKLADWITKKADLGQEFAKSLRAGVCKFGSLTEKQEAAVRRNIAQEKEQVW